ncbi:MAG: transposase [Blastocatellia bacterium]|nr:transposase [Blastocatellia bacterium]
MAILNGTLSRYAECCNWMNETVDRNVTARFAIHHQTYHPARVQFGLSANLTCTAIARVAGARKTAHAKKRTVKAFKPTSVTFDERIFTYREASQSVTLTLLGSRQTLTVQLGKYQEEMLAGQKPTSATLVKRRNGAFWIQMQVKVDAPEPQPPTGFLGVDLGIRRIAVTSDGQKFDGKDVQNRRTQFAQTRTSVQRRKAQKRTRSTARLLKRLAGRERRFQAWVNHNLSKQLVAVAKATGRTLRMEDLKGIRERTKVRKAQRRTQHSWAFYQLRSFVTYKAAVAGVGVEFVNPASTSKACFVCQQIGHRDALVFKCENPDCSNRGVEIDADYNGALNIAAGGVVNRPEVQAKSAVPF